MIGNEIWKMSLVLYKIQNYACVEMIAIVFQKTVYIISLGFMRRACRIIGASPLGVKEF